MPEPKTPWPHAPTHQLATSGTFFVSASTWFKAHHFRGATRLRVLHRGQWRAIMAGTSKPGRFSPTTIISSPIALPINPPPRASA
jgi:hypothetical protein